MTLFDRRLLAYFDDGLGAGSTTLFDRIVDYQKDLGEIERELKKYKMLLGDREVQCKIRDPDRWIRKNANQKTIKERYRKVAEEIVDVEPPEDARYDYQDRRASVQSGRRASMARGKARASRPSINPRHSLASNQHRASVAAASKALAVWVQIDTIYRLPTPRASEYVVRASWLHHPNYVETTEAKPLTRGEDGDEVCVVRQQLKLEAQQNAQMVVISVHRRGDDHGDKVGFYCELNVDDTHNHEAQIHPLRDHLGNKDVAELRLRLARPGTSHAPGTAPREREGVRRSMRLSQYDVPGSSSSKRSSVAQQRRSVAAMTPIDEGTGSLQEPSSRRGSQTITQDPVALEPVNPPQGGRLSVAGQQGAEAAKAAAALAKSTTSTPAVSEVPNSSVADDPSQLDDDYGEEEEEEEEEVESSMQDEYEEEEEEFEEEEVEEDEDA